MNKILVTGGSGFIGTNLITQLLKDGHQVLSIDKLPPVIRQHSSNWKQADINDLEVIKEIFFDFNPEIIIHLAAITDLDGTDLLYYKTNIEGTQNIIDIASGLTNLETVLFTSSMYVCEPGYIPTDYDTYKPHTVYGESKVKGEQLVKQIKNNTYSWIIIRPTSIWGPWFKIPYIDFFNIVYQGKYFDFGRDCIKTYGYVENTVYQIRKLMLLSSANGKTFYLGDIPATKINEWANEIAIAMGLKKIKKIPFILMKTASLVGDVLKAFKIKFPITSFRLKNMTTNNILPLDNLYNAVGDPPYKRVEGVERTLNWLKEEKGYDFKNKN
jgi:nucleoside-diphosphate-sugar epimerase